MNITKTSFMKEKANSKNLFILLAVIIGFIFIFQSVNTTPAGKNAFSFFTSDKDFGGDEMKIQVVTEESAVIDVVKKSTPAVVSIVASAEVPKLGVCYREDSPFQDDFFGDFFNFRTPYYCEQGTETRRVGAGSGFLVSSDGYILTNKHVVSNEEAEYTVILNDEENKDQKVIAKVLAKDPVNDIAVLKIDKKNLPFLPLGDSEKLQVGQTAIAIGYALGEFDNTVSKGVVSGLSRNITASGTSFGESEQLEGVIQTDAAINPGNSGGPLLDISGNVIGMNVAMAAGQNIGFAVPVNEVKKAYNDVKETGSVQRAFLGVRYILVTKELKEKNTLPVDYGALVIRGEDPTELAVVPGSPADIAGIVENDIILEVDGTKIDNKNSLSQIINRLKIGQNVSVTIYHKGEEKDVTIKLESRE